MSCVTGAVPYASGGDCLNRLLPLCEGAKYEGVHLSGYDLGKDTALWLHSILIGGLGQVPPPDIVECMTCLLEIGSKSPSGLSLPAGR